MSAKICGLTRRSDAELAAAAGATHAGVILARGGRRSIDPSLAATLLEGLPLRKVGVFVNGAPAEVAEAARTARLDVLQLHGDEGVAEIEALRREGGWEIWKAVRPRGADDFRAAVDAFGERVDGILLDGWSPVAPGGTGASFPWEEIAPVRAILPPGILLIAAGGLDAGNVGRAIDLLAPDLVDVSSGVELSPGIKDPAAVPAFVAAARRAMNEMRAKR